MLCSGQRNGPTGKPWALETTTRPPDAHGSPRGRFTLTATASQTPRPGRMPTACPWEVHACRSAYELCLSFSSRVCLKKEKSFSRPSADRGAVAEISRRSSAAPTAGIEDRASKSHPGGMPDRRLLRRKTTARRQGDPACAKMRRLAPRRGAWDAWAMITGGFAALNHRLISGNPPGSAKSPAGLERQPPNVPVILYSFPALQQETECLAETQGRGGISRRLCASARDRLFSSVHRGKRMWGRGTVDQGMGTRESGTVEGSRYRFFSSPCPAFLCPSSAHLAVGGRN